MVKQTPLAVDEWAKELAAIARQDIEDRRAYDDEGFWLLVITAHYREIREAQRAASPGSLAHGLLKHWEWRMRETLVRYGVNPGRGLLPRDDSPAGIRREWDQMRKWVAPLIFERDGGICMRCGRSEELTVNHIIPISLGGRNALDNFQTLCARCNASKGARS